jgi:hypothetical protein
VNAQDMQSGDRYYVGPWSSRFAVYDVLNGDDLHSRHDDELSAIAACAKANANWRKRPGAQS